MMSSRFVLCFAPGLTVILLACHQREATTTTPTFTVTNPVRTSAQIERELVADVQAARHIELRARIRGVVEEVLVDEGQLVRKGQRLFTISAREAEAAVRQANAQVLTAKAALTQATLEAQSAKRLFDKGVIAATELALANAKQQAAEATVEQAEAQTQQAKINASYTEVRAPFDGAVNRLPKRVGALVSEGDLLTTLSDCSEMLAYFHLPEAEALAYSGTAQNDASKNVRLVLANGQVFSGTGRIDAVESEVSKDTGTVALRARLQNPERTLKHGGTGKVVLSQTLHDVVIVPKTATFEIQDQLYVFVVDENAVVKSKRLRPTRELKESYIIASGLEAEDRVILDGQQKLHDGDRITVRSASSLASLRQP